MTDLWNNPRGNSVVSFPPSRDDLFVAVLLEGKVAALWPVTEYDHAMRKAEALTRTKHPERPFVAKVIPLTAQEAQTLGLLPERLFADMTPEQHAEMQRAIYDNCIAILQNSTDPVARADAVKLLRDMGALR
ncbi:hypothetical protein FGG78_23430 [Thioclava sp. BHET1]|nr:hypothetical protein FGG78_23430 [Thioclava sp. BHET1]